MKVNPVTGKMEAMTAAESGGQRDGCLVLPEKYMNAAKDLGLGGAAGVFSERASAIRSWRLLSPREPERQHLCAPPFLLARQLPLMCVFVRDQSR